jgi:rhodanese-related sulfurtransferase
VYCSIGVRSEKIGEKLIKLGYKMSITCMANFGIKQRKEVVNNLKVMCALTIKMEYR